ncbi:MAG: helix-turn-helix domain-containing protein [Streptosporangiaceae bacterium]
MTVPAGHLGHMSLRTEVRLVADNEHPSIPARRLAERLRDLREREYGQFTQKQLARALGGADPLSIATISQWEKPGSGRLPPPQRLEAYARLFCTGRSFTSGAPRLLRESELTEQERERQAELYAELLSLRELAVKTQASTSSEPGSSIWHFPDGKAVSIICSDAPARPPYADPGHLNYSRYARYADLDALVEVFGQLRSENPASVIRILGREELVGDFALNYLVSIGGAAAGGVAPYFAPDLPLPKAEEIPDTDTHLFRCNVGDEVRELTSTRDARGTLVQDVGIIARGPHLVVQERTVTVLSGITSRGVHGAALCFIDSRVRDANEQYLKDTFRNTDAFCIAMKIPVINNVALPPNLWREDVRLYEWSDGTGARW